MSNPEKSAQSTKSVIAEPHVDFKNKELVCPWCGKREALLVPTSTADAAREMFQFNLAHQECEQIDKRMEIS